MIQYNVVSLIYTIIGSISSFLTISLIISYFIHHQRYTNIFYPKRILINITTLNALFSLRFTLDGIVGLIKGRQALQHSFGLLNYDCLFEGLFAFTLLIYLTGWNILWLFDLWYGVKNPKHFQDDMTAYYMILIYFSGTMVAFITLFSCEDLLFGLSNWTQTCFVHDGIFYYSIIDTLVAIYSVIGIIFLFKANVKKRLLGQPSLPIFSFLVQKKLYILIILLTNIWGVFYQIFDQPFLRYAFIVSIALQPGLVTIPWLWSYFQAQANYRKSLKKKVKTSPKYRGFDARFKKSFFNIANESFLQKKERGGMRENQFTSDNLSDTSNSERVSSSSYSFDSPRQSTKIRKKIHREISQLLISGIQIAFHINYRKGSSFYQSKSMKIKEQLNFVDARPKNKCLQVFCCCFYRIIFGKAQNLRDQEEIEAERGEMVFGHTAIMNKIDLISKDQIIFQSKICQSYDIHFHDHQVKNLRKLQEEPLTAKLIASAPRIFKNLRNMHNISQEDIYKTFNSYALKNGKLRYQFESNDEAGEINFKIHSDSRNMKLVTINQEEYKTLIGMLPNYYAYYCMNPKSYLLSIYGCFTLQIGSEQFIQPQHFLLLPDVLNSDCPKDQLTSDCRVLNFQIKGSGADRSVLMNPGPLRDPLSIDQEQIQQMLGQQKQQQQEYQDDLRLNLLQPASIKFHKFLKTLFKDQDFIDSFGKLDITNDQAQNIISQFNEDLSFLIAHDFYDYSLNLKVVVKPYGKIHLLHSLREESTFLLEEGNRGLYIIDDRKQAIVLKEQGSENKFFHVCEKSALHVIQRFDQSLQPLIEEEAFNNKNENLQEDKQPTQFSILDESNTQSQYVQLFFDGQKQKMEIQSDKKLRTLSKSTIQNKKQSEHQRKTQIMKQQKRSNILNTLINRSSVSSPFKASSRLLSTIISTNQLHIINFQSRSNFNFHNQTINAHGNNFLNYQKQHHHHHQQQQNNFLGHSILNPIKSQISSDEQSDKKDMFNLRTKCKLCHQNFPKNHIIRVSHDGSSKVVPNRDVVEREQIEQIIIDPIHGVVKRQFHFAIVGYITPLSKRKLIRRYQDNEMQDNNGDRNNNNNNNNNKNTEQQPQQQQQQSRQYQWQRKSQDQILDPMVYSEYFMRVIEEILQ